MLQPAMHANLNRGTLPPPPPGLLGWPTGPALPAALPQPLEEVNGEYGKMIPSFNRIKIGEKIIGEEIIGAISSTKR